MIVKDKERIQPRSGRLDLLLQDPDYARRYEVEIQLGKTDESHIIRTIEYWDIERKRYPSYEHVAVIVAEDITSRYLNVISLFNGAIPLIALQMQAVKLGDQIGLVFTKVLDLLQLGVEAEEDEEAEPTDRSYWEQRASKATLAMTDTMLEISRQFDPSLNLKYNKFYIGLVRNGQPNNFVVFRPKKDWVRCEPRLDRSDEVSQLLDSAGLNLMDYDSRWRRYRIRLGKDDVHKHKELLTNLFRRAYEEERA